MRPGHREKSFDLLVFDWDGTLVDSIGAIVGCTQRALEQVGAAPVADDTVRRAIGLGIREMVEVLVPGCDDDLFQRICLAYREHWFEGLGAAHRPFEGVGSMLTELAAAGYLLAVATAKSRRGLAADLERTGLAGHFVASRTVDEAPGKPHPGMLEGLMDELGAGAERTLMIGDTTHDLEMAANAGTASLAVLSGAQERAQLERLAPLTLLDSVCELPTWLRSRGELRADQSDADVG